MIKITEICKSCLYIEKSVDAHNKECPVDGKPMKRLISGKAGEVYKYLLEVRSE